MFTCYPTPLLKKLTLVQKLQLLSDVSPMIQFHLDIEINATNNCHFEPAVVAEWSKAVRSHSRGRKARKPKKKEEARINKKKKKKKKPTKSLSRIHNPQPENLCYTVGI